MPYAPTPPRDEDSGADVRPLVEIYRRVTANGPSPSVMALETALTIYENHMLAVPRGPHEEGAGECVECGTVVPSDDSPTLQAHALDSAVDAAVIYDHDEEKK